MNRYLKIPALLGCLLLLSSVAWSQGSSANYQLNGGDLVAGGGSSASSGYGVAGSVPLGGANNSFSASYQLSGGVSSIVAGADAAFTYAYMGAAAETVPIADKMLKVVVGGDTAGVAATFNYRYGGQNAYTSATMTRGSDDTLRYVVSSSMLGVRLLEYYIVITRSSSSYYIGGPVSPYVFIGSFDNAYGQRPSALPEASYRIVGVPIALTLGNSVSAVFPDDLGSYNITSWRMGRYTAPSDTVLEYPGIDDVVPGRGYWLIARGGKRYGAAGGCVLINRSVVASDFYEYPLDAGWNQVANPFPYPVGWGDMRFDDAGVVSGPDPVIVEPDPYYYDGTGYTNNTVIPAWEGIFVYAKKAGLKILWPAEEAGAAPLPPAKEQPWSASSGDWRIALKLEANGLVDDHNFAGVMRDASDALDTYDRMEPPPPPGAPGLGLTSPTVDTDLMRADYRAPFGSRAEWDIVLRPGSDRRLSFTGLDQVPAEMKVWLVLDVGIEYELDDDRTINLPNDVRMARLTVSSTKPETDLPLDYALHQNFPNPFNPKTTLRYALPTAGQVTIEIINILGQRVTTLVEGEMPAGHHAVEWDGRNSSGSEAASGIYFARMVVNDFRDFKKLLLLK